MESHNLVKQRRRRCSKGKIWGSEDCGGLQFEPFQFKIPGMQSDCKGNKSFGAQNLNNPPPFNTSGVVGLNQTKI